jgi:hypothetical protein
MLRARISLELLLRRVDSSSGAVVRPDGVPLSPLRVAQKSAGLFGSFPRLIRASLSALGLLCCPLGGLCRNGLLALSLLFLCPRSRQLFLEPTASLDELPGLGAIASFPRYRGTRATRGRCPLAGRPGFDRGGAEQTHGLRLAYEPAGREFGRRPLVQHRCVQRGANSLFEGPGDRGARFPRDRCRITGELGNKLTLLGGCTPESGAVPPASSSFCDLRRRLPVASSRSISSGRRRASRLSVQAVMVGLRSALTASAS